MNELEAVDLVDKLMICFRNDIRPSDEVLVKAYEAHINVEELEAYIRGFELEEHETD